MSGFGLETFKMCRERYADGTFQLEDSYENGYESDVLTERWLLASTL